MPQTIRTMLGEKLKGYRIILASGSPRRQELLGDMGIPFELRIKSIEESYPNHLKGEEISEYLAKKKAGVFLNQLDPNDILITADTVVWHQGSSLEKPSDNKEAYAMLTALSGDWHEVITSVCITHRAEFKLLSAHTQVKFAALTPEEIRYYIDQFQPFDKAGAYGIQEWLGLVGIESISGSYTNVVGLPTQAVYNALKDLLNQKGL